MDVLLLFPGQGSQKPGMAKDLVEAFREARDVWDRTDEALGEKLSRVAFDGSADELMLTYKAQQAILAHGAAVWAVVHEKLAAYDIDATGLTSADETVRDTG